MDIDTSNSILATRSLGHATSNRWLFRDVDLSLARGECLVILGLSGSGKSTLVRLLAGLERPHAGTVSTGGSIGVVFQDPALFEFDNLTVGDNLTLAGATPGEGVATLLSSVGLAPELAVSRPANLSGGQRRRVALARALAARPAGLLYDEPTAGLDAASALLVAELIRRTATERSLASLVVTHDLEVAAHVADRVLLMSTDGGSLTPVVGHSIADLRAAVDALARTPPRTTSEPLPVGRTSSTPFFLSPFEAIGTAVVLLSGVLFVAREGSIRRRLGALLPGAVALSATGAAAVGLVVALQSAAGLDRFEAGHLLPEVASASMVREVLPLLIGLLLAGRIGAAISAEMGSYALSGQIAALRLLGKRPAPYLASPLLWAVALVLPVATLAGLATGLGGLVFGASGLLKLKPSLVLDGIQRAVHLDDLYLALGKSLAFGLAIAVASYRHGITPKADPAELGQGATRGVVEASMAVVLLDCLITQLTHR